MNGLARLRRSKGFSQRALAKDAGVSPSTIYEIEAGRHSPNPSTLRKLANALDVSTEEVLGAVEGPKARAPLPLENLNTVERGALFRSWADFLDQFTAMFAHHLNELPDQPTADEWARGKKLIEMLLAVSSMALHSLRDSRVMGMMGTYLMSINVSEPVPERHRQAAIDLHASLSYLFSTLFPRARAWVTRQDERTQLEAEIDHVVAEWSRLKAK